MRTKLEKIFKQANDISRYNTKNHKLRACIKAV